MKYVFFSFFFALTLGVHSQDLNSVGIDTLYTVPEGLATGAYAPDFTLSNGKEDVTLSEKLKEGPVVLVFYRGEWCPYCNKYMSALNDSLSHISAAGAQVIAVTPEIGEYAESMMAENDLNFNVLSADGSSVLTDYDLLFRVTKRYTKKIKVMLRTDLAEVNNQEDVQLPVPAVFVISKSGKVTWRYFNYDYRQRPPVNDILKALESIN